MLGLLHWLSDQGPQGSKGPDSAPSSARQNGRLSRRASMSKKKIVSPEERTFEDILSEFALNNETLRRMMAQMDRRMTQGLAGAGQSTISMLLSFVPGLPDGREEGHFLAMDLGGTNLRVLLLNIAGGKVLDTQQRNFRMMDKVMQGTGTELFDFMVSKIADFVYEKGLEDEDMSLGFTFSYPCIQTGLTSAKLVRWTKGFNASGVEGRDVVALLQEAIARHGGIKVRVGALMNDTVGTQVATAFEHGDCTLGVIVATGTNCSYIERSENIPKLAGKDWPYPEMLINTEWGGFGDNGEAEYIRTQYDRTVDQNSVHPGVQSFDKLVAGMYMGETVRLVLADLIRARLLFTGVDPEELEDSDFFRSMTFHTKYISEILSDESTRSEGGRSYPHTRQILEELGIFEGYSISDILILREAASVVSRRSANLAAGAIACVVTRSAKKTLTVGIDGSTYRFHPFFHLWCRDKLKELIGDDVEVKLVQAGDGSGKGAALVAAIAASRGLS